MNHSKLHPAEAWNACSPGTLGQLSRRIRVQRRRQAAIRIAAPLAMIVLVTLGVWSVNRPVAPQPFSFNYGGVTCRQVEANMQQYAASQLPPDTQRAFAEHLALCPLCQQKMNAMRRGAMPVGAATEAVTENPVVVWTHSTRSRDENVPEGFTLHRSRAASALN